MANMGDLQALLRDLGASRVKLDTVARQLRAEGWLSVLGHGPSAARIGAREAALMLLATAGSSKAVQASKRLEVLASLRNAQHRTLVDVLTEQLEAPSVHVDELRVSRRSDWAALITDGCEEAFSSPRYQRLDDHVRTEGIFTGYALERVRALLAGPSPMQRRRQRKRGKAGTS